MTSYKGSSGRSEHSIQENPRSQYEKLSWDSECVTMSSDRSSVTIDLRDRFGNEEVFDAHNLICTDFIGESLKIKILSNAEIIKAVKITSYYPTIWSGMHDELIQFIYLFDLGYKDVHPLIVENGIIEYPAYGLGAEAALKDHFRRITKNQIFSSIRKVPSEYERKTAHLIFEYNSWQSEKATWDEITREYAPGDLTNTDNSPFEIEPYEIDLVVTFKGGKCEFTKTFHDEAIIGN